MDFSHTASSAVSFFESQDFGIDKPTVLFYDSGSQFSLNFTYNIGGSTESTNFTLFQENCTSTVDVSEIISITNTENEDIGKVDVFVDKRNIQESSLVTRNPGVEGFAKGVINFCIKAETIFKGISVEFLKTNVALTYDLTNNTFEVKDNIIHADTVKSTNTTVLTNYGVDAYRCFTNSYTKDDSPQVLTQGELIAICLEPNTSS